MILFGFRFETYFDNKHPGPQLAYHKKKLGNKVKQVLCRFNSQLLTEGGRLFGSHRQTVRHTKRSQNFGVLVYYTLTL